MFTLLLNSHAWATETLKGAEEPTGAIIVSKALLLLSVSLLVSNLCRNCGKCS
jgi:hypothetical protein